VLAVNEDMEYVTIGAAAEALGVNRRRIRELIQGGELEAITNPLDRREKLIPLPEIERLEKFARSVKKDVA
jgi:hypothetical protein